MEYSPSLIKRAALSSGASEPMNSPVASWISDSGASSPGDQGLPPLKHRPWVVHEPSLASGSPPSTHPVLPDPRSAIERRGLARRRHPAEAGAVDGVDEDDDPVGSIIRAVGTEYGRPRRIACNATSCRPACRRARTVSGSRDSSGRSSCPCPLDQTTEPVGRRTIVRCDRSCQSI